MRKNKLTWIEKEKILRVGGILLLMVLFSTFAYAATSIELTTGNFINVFGNLNLSGNNLVNAGNVSIKGNLSVDGNVSVDGSTFFVDATGDRVGIGTTNPREELQVNTNGPAATLIFNEETDSRPGSTIIGEVVFAGDTTSGSSYRNFTKIDTGITDDSTATYTGFMRFLTSNSGTLAERMRITGAGNVGIGTTNPTSGTGVGRVLEISGGDSGLSLNSTTAGVRWSIDSQTSGKLFISQGSTARMVVENNTGNVGIGITSPTEKLQVHGNIHIRHEGDQILRFTEANKAVRWAIGVPATGSSDQTGADLVFRGNGANNLTAPEGTEYMRITSTGSVGIGTIVPQVKLHVNSTGAAIIAQSGVSSQGEIQYTGLRICSNAAVSTGDYIGLTFPGSGDGGSRSRAGIGAKFTSGATAADLVFMTRSAADGTELSSSDVKMVIDSSGNVGIGPAGPNPN